MNWYYAINGVQQGPVPEETLRILLAQGSINASTLIWHEGMAGWQPLATALPDLAAGTPPPPPPYASAYPYPQAAPSAPVDDSSNPFHWFGVCIRKYATFSGRARRKEYWMFLLANFLIAFALGFVSGFLGLIDARGNSPLVSLYNLFTLLPTLSVTARRLHDINRTGWWQCAGVALIPFFIVAMVPIVGGDEVSGALLGVFVVTALLAAALGITLFVFYCTAGTVGPNKYGPDPKRPQ